MSFDIYAINLERRTDRKQNVIKQFEKFDFCNVKIFKAIENRKGSIGCALSHLALIEFAKQNDMPYIIVAEDDILLNDTIQAKEFKKILTSLTENFDKYDIFNGSPSFWDKRNNINEIKKTKTFHHRFSFVSDAQKATFMIYTKKSYDKILSEYNPNNTRLEIDQYFARYFMQLCYKKYLCYEIKSYSDIGRGISDLINYIKNQEEIYKSLQEKDIFNKLYDF